jgi:hypothetical protein
MALMIRRLALGVAAAALLCSAGQAQADLIVNGSFENYVIGPNDTNFGSFVRFFSPPPNTDIAGWTITGSNGGNPNNVDLVHSFLYPAYAGNESLDMSGNIGAAGVIQQTFATHAGTSYALSFAYGNNPAGGGASMDFMIMGAALLLSDSVSHNTSTFGNMDYKIYTGVFTADSSSATLIFSSTTNSGFGIALDAVSVNTPEPATLVSLGLGAVSVIVYGRRRRRMSAA